MQLLLFSIAYAIGSIPTGAVIAKFFFQTDITKHGSGNIGATNVARTLGKKIGAITLLGDMAKSLVPILLVKYLGFDELSQWMVGIAAFLGHCFSIYLKFHGGKGVATGLGCALALSPISAVIALLIFLTAYKITKMVSVGSLVSTLSLPITIWFVHHDISFVAVFTIIAVVIFVRHRENIVRIIHGQELKIK